MASEAPRPRSNTTGSTKSARGPKSRASTASIASATTQPARYHPYPLHHAHDVQIQHAAARQYTPEEMISHSEQQLTNPNQPYALDPSLQYHHAHGRALSVDHGYSANAMNLRPSVEQFNPHEGKENQGMEANESQGPEDGKKKKGSASSLANDAELRRLFRENVGRDLKDVAAQVLANERGPRSEKTKQIFAMLWLHAVCKRQTGSVPRNRVFSHYATRCGTERVPPLNPASFGKLVRIIFPGITTRRLGMRGESKYHYVDLTLTDDNAANSPDVQADDGFGSRAPSERPILKRQQSHFAGDRAEFPPPDVPFNPVFQGQDSKARQSHSIVPEGLYLDTAPQNFQQDPSKSDMATFELKFPVNEDDFNPDDDQITLPSLHPYLPPGTDIDTAGSLSALYRTHCVSVIDSFRFCKERGLWQHFTSFHGTLTVPVQKLFAHPNLASWIKECDWLMYRKMIRFISPLALQVVPVKVIDTFRTISNKLGPHISATFSSHPQHVRDARLGPASLFASLLDRLLRVNATAHAAANMLTNSMNRDQMWLDWVLYVHTDKVVCSALPGCGYVEVQRILISEMRDLLGALSSTNYNNMLEPFKYYIDNHSQYYPHHMHVSNNDGSTEGVLDRWAIFLQSLPSRFPGVDARRLIQIVGEVGNAALRDITIAQAASFGSWWVTKVWVDEMLLWMAEKGGFMEHGPDTMQLRVRPESAVDNTFAMDETSEVFGSRPQTAVSGSADGPSRYSSIDVVRDVHVEHIDSTNLQNSRSHSAHDFRGSAIHRHGLDPLGAARKIEMHGLHDQFDDSGIALEMDHERLSLPTGHDELRIADYGGFVNNTVNEGSDPANVVVC